MNPQLNIEAIAAALNTTPDGVRERYRLGPNPTLLTLCRIMVDSGLSWDEVLL